MAAFSAMGAFANPLKGAMDRARKKRITNKQQASSDMAEAADYAGSFRKGGVVKKTGMAKVHRGERVLTKAESKRYRKQRRK